MAIGAIAKQRISRERNCFARLVSTGGLFLYPQLLRKAGLQEPVINIGRLKTPTARWFWMYVE